jgi:putative FmdB family regulatory protein
LKTLEKAWACLSYNRFNPHFQEISVPIYAYRCTDCGFEKDVMHKISDPVHTTCPSCNTENFAKQLTAPGFQLKGTGWYATDFKGGAKPADAKKESSTDASVPPCQVGTAPCPCN